MQHFLITQKNRKDKWHLPADDLMDALEAIEAILENRFGKIKWEVIEPEQVATVQYGYGWQLRIERLKEYGKE